MRQTITIATTTLLESVITRIVDIADYFIYKKHVSMCEGFLFAIVIVRGPWYAINGIKGSVVDYVWPDWVWVAIFTVLGVTHFAAFFFRSCYPRAVIVALYAVLWMFLAILSVIASTLTPAAPTFGIFAFFSLLMAVRINRDCHQADAC